MVGRGGRWEGAATKKMMSSLSYEALIVLQWKLKGKEIEGVFPIYPPSFEVYNLVFSPRFECWSSTMWSPFLHEMLTFEYEKMFSKASIS